MREVMISYGRQSIDAADVAAVCETLQSPFLTQGPKVAELEAALCALTGARYAVLVANGTAALHIAVAVLDLPPGGEGITSPITFTATANSMLYCGIKPVFADIDPESFCISPQAVERRVNAATCLLSPVHFAGRLADMAALRRIADRHDLRIIEDGAHAIGSSYPCGAAAGSCKYSDLTIFSFHPVKTITTGEGGAVMTNDPELYRRLLALRSHGITKDPAELLQNPGPWYYEMHSLGFNYRMTDIQAALGISQLTKLEAFRKRRLAIVRQYNAAFRGLPHLRIPSERDEASMCFHLYALRVDFPGLGISRADFMAALRERGVGTQVHYIPVHLQPYYQERFGYSAGLCPEAEAFYEEELSLPLYPDLTDADVELVIEAVKTCSGLA